MAVVSPISSCRRGLVPPLAVSRANSIPVMLARATPAASMSMVKGAVPMLGGARLSPRTVPPPARKACHLVTTQADRSEDAAPSPGASRPTFAPMNTPRLIFSAVAIATPRPGDALQSSILSCNEAVSSPRVAQLRPDAVECSKLSSDDLDPWLAVQSTELLVGELLAAAEETDYPTTELQALAGAVRETSAAPSFAAALYTEIPTASEKVAAWSARCQAMEGDAASSATQTCESDRASDSSPRSFTGSRESSATCELPPPVIKGDIVEAMRELKAMERRLVQEQLLREQMISKYEARLKMKDESHKRDVAQLEEMVRTFMEEKEQLRSVIISLDQEPLKLEKKADITCASLATSSTKSSASDHSGDDSHSDALSEAPTSSSPARSLPSPMLEQQAKMHCDFAGYKWL